MRVNIATPGVVGIAVLLSVTTTRPLAAQEETKEQSVQRGAEVYGYTCGRCHNPRSPLERHDRSWVVIANHMRARAGLTGREVRAVIAFLQATNGSTMAVESAVPSAEHAEEENTTPPSSDPAVIALGQSLVQQRACVGCHVVVGTGGNVGPNLGGVVARRGPGFVRQKLHNPSFNNATSMMPNFNLSDEQVEAILAYLAQINGENEE